MIAKLTVRKYETESHFKSLFITISEGDDSSQVKYSSWTEDQSENDIHKKKDVRSSRLVVKIATGADLQSLDLDSCANRVDESDDVNNQKLGNTKDQHQQNHKKPNTKASIPNSSCHTVSPNLLNTKEDNEFGSKSIVIKTVNINSLTKSKSLTSLENSLEKVKANNAKIMENIQVLNRTLYFTQKKEISDVNKPKPLRYYPCNECGKSFVYETGLRRHHTMRHSMSDMTPRWQIVWTCIECFQVWPRQNLALEHSKLCCKADSIDFVIEIKTSSLLQCEFCERVFTSIPRLLRHSNNHTTISNYECNACDLNFRSYKMAVQHWLSCPWLTLCYSFSLPKQLLCNSCDRKFRSYDQLYGHRYKMGHYMTKSHTHSVQSLISFVYQCELCGQWFPSVPPLLKHRSQSHAGEHIDLSAKD